MKPKVLVIVGPTASGKSDLAVKIAKKFNGEIISADSRQVYKGLNVGSGKIARKEMLGIPHHLLNVVHPKKTFTASDYKELASEALEKIIERKKLPIVVGGTGFYIDTLTGLATLPDVPPNRELRKKLEKKTAEQLFKMLEEKDPSRAKVIDRHNKVRLIRALEIIGAIGHVPKVKRTKSKYEFVYLGINPKDLDKKIYNRLKKRLPGIIREVKKLYSQGLSWKRMHGLGLEYRYVSLYARKKIEKKEMTEKLYMEILHYAKRQMTWFKRNKKIVWSTDAKSAFALSTELFPAGERRRLSR